MSFETALQKLRSIQQEKLLGDWERLNKTQRAHLFSQIEALDEAQFLRQQAQVLNTTPSASQSFEPFQDYSLSEIEGDHKRGLRVISEGKVGCLLIAGGQGTRLGFNAPKGLYPISLIKHKSLFQLFAEKTVAASHQASFKLPLAILTSPLNHRDVVDFFEQQRYFGLDPSQLDIFPQSLLPFLDTVGNLLLEEPGSLAMGPDGNGSALEGLIQSGIWSKWQGQGVRLLHYVLIDNPLADPFDATLTGFQERMGADLTIKGTQRLHVDEKVGLLVRRGKTVQVIEYSEFPAQERMATLSDGTLKHRCANLSLFCFSANFINRLDREKLWPQMPLHMTLKPIKAAHSLTAWKFEKFIFDLLPWATNPQVLMYPREECFAPLKNREGTDSPATVQQALYQMDKRVYSRLSGLEAPRRPFELAQAFYYPTPHQLAQWRGKPLPDADYIEI